MTVKKFDVVVVGGGASGVMAAVAASGTGAKTLLIEKNSFFGGTATASMVGQFFAFYHKDQRTVVGIPGKLLESIKAASGSTDFTRYIMAEASDSPLSLMGFPSILKY
jgi:succinate dehydrogenase/fumarate reductase flavoprotein subunit